GDIELGAEQSAPSSAAIGLPAPPEAAQHTGVGAPAGVVAVLGEPPLGEGREVVGEPVLVLEAAADSVEGGHPEEVDVPVAGFERSRVISGLAQAAKG